MKGLRWAISIVIFIAIAGCEKGAESDSVAAGDGAKWRDPNFEILTIGTVNYTDYAIAGLYVMPIDKSDIEFAASGSVRRPMPATATDWEMGSSGPTLAWDRRWKAPHKFKVWWQRVFDEEVFSKAGPYPKDGNMFDPYDPYTTKQTRPGSAWCEGEVEIKEQFGQSYGPPFPNLTRNEVVLYFYPDGTVKGSLEFGGYEDMKLIEIKRRYELPVLKGKACLREVPNPLYGKPRPRAVN